MAAITTAEVTVLQTYEAGDRSAKSVNTTKRLAIVLSAQGGTAGDIPASVLGFTEIYEVRAACLLVSSTPKATLAFANPDGTEVITANLAQATDANRIDRANLTGTLYVTVTGRSL